MSRRVGQLVFGVALVWLAALYPAKLISGESGVLFTGVAALICLLPAVGTLLWCEWSFKGSPERQLAAVMGGTGVRMFVVIGIGMALFFLVEEFEHTAFWIWVVVFYLATLALEIAVLVAGRSAADRTGHP